MINYKNVLYKDYVDLLYSIIKADDQEFSERIFPHSQYFYIRAALQEKFPNQKWTVRKVKQIIDEELALKTITLKDEKGLLSASSYDLTLPLVAHMVEFDDLQLIAVEPQDLLEGYPLGDIDFRDLIDESLVEVIAKKLYIDQESLGKEFEEILLENLDELYVQDTL